MIVVVVVGVADIEKENDVIVEVAAVPNKVETTWPSR